MLEQTALTARVASLESELSALRLKADGEAANAKEIIDALVIANNAFRTAMLGRMDPPTIDGIYIAKAKNTWATFDVSVLMQFYEVFSAHHQIFNDLVIQKKGRNAISDHLLAKAAANAAEVKAFNERVDIKKTAKAAKAAPNGSSPEAISEADKNKKKALAGLMKTLGITETAAREMLAKAEAK